MSNISGAKISGRRFGLSEENAKAVSDAFKSFSEDQLSYAIAIATRIANIRAAIEQVGLIIDPYSGINPKEIFTAVELNEMAAEYEDTYDPIDEENLEPRWSELIREKMKSGNDSN